MRTLLLLAGLLLLAQAQAPYAVEGVARYRGYYPLGSWEGVNPTPRGEVLWEGLGEGLPKAGGLGLGQRRAGREGAEDP